MKPEWQPIETAPRGRRVLIAYAANGATAGVYVDFCTLKARGDPKDRDSWDYINSHNGDPRFWMDAPEPPQEGWHEVGCGCDGCMFRDEDWWDKRNADNSGESR